VAGTTVLVAVCDKVSTITSGAGWIGCLHAISLSDLLRSYGEGNRVWVLAHGDCGACSRGKVESVFSRVAHLNSMLRQRGRPAILLREVSAQAGLSLLAAAVAPATRRGFFRSLARRPATLLNADLVMENGRRQAPGEYLPVGDDAMMPWVVKLDPTCCIACHACARVCPEGAIRFDKEVPAYRLRHRACTGCGLCVDVCERQAVKIRSWAEPTQTSMTLAEKRCRSCGVDFHFPLARTDSSAQCWVCTHSRPSQRLYQVME
jgi:ferredoxin